MITPALRFQLYFRLALLLAVVGYAIATCELAVVGYAIATGAI